MLLGVVVFRVQVLLEIRELSLSTNYFQTEGYTESVTHADKENVHS